MNHTRIIVTVIMLISIVLYYNQYYNKHLFWNSTQPIYDVLKKDGVIKDVSNLTVVEPSKGMNIIEFDKSNIDNIDIFIDFINKHFDQYVIQMREYIKFNCGNTYKLVGLEKDNQLVGTISGKYTSIMVNNKKYKSIYVDYLCIHKDFRDKHYAPILISMIIKNMKSDNYPTAFYRLDSMRHHFKHFYVSSYYYYDLKNKIGKKCVDNISIKSTILDKNNLSLIKKFYHFHIKNISIFKIYENITQEEFSMKIKNKISTTMVFQENDNIIGYITYLDTTYNIFDKQSSVIEVHYFIFSNERYSNSILSKFIKHIPSKFEYIYLLNNYYNNYMIAYLNMTKTNESYFYLYNYFLNGSYNKKNCIMF
jgi:hypothetical protein